MAAFAATRQTVSLANALFAKRSAALLWWRVHALPYHPLWHEGYVSIGDTHTTRPFGLGMREQDTRFFGLKRECGIHGLDG